jgi:hypothetical protein
MPTLDPEKNKQYVAKHRAMTKAIEETKEEVAEKIKQQNLKLDN